MTSAMDVQHGGDHYKGLAIQPAEYNQRNGVGWCEGEAIKYATRHKDKGKARDIKKAVHCLHIALEIEYGIVGTATYGDDDVGMPAGQGHAPSDNPSLPPGAEVVLCVDSNQIQIAQLPDIVQGGGFEVQAKANNYLGIGWVSIKTFLHKDFGSTLATLRAARAFGHVVTGNPMPFDIVWLRGATTVLEVGQAIINEDFKPPCPTEPCPGCESCNGPGAVAVHPLAAVQPAPKGSDKLSPEHGKGCQHAWHKVPSVVHGDTCPSCGAAKRRPPERCPHLWHVSPAHLRPPNCPDCGSEIP